MVALQSLAMMFETRNLVEISMTSIRYRGQLNVLLLESDNWNVSLWLLNCMLWWKLNKNLSRSIPLLVVFRMNDGNLPQASLDFLYVSFGVRGSIEHYYKRFLCIRLTVWFQWFLPWVPWIPVHILYQLYLFGFFGVLTRQRAVRFGGSTFEGSLDRTIYHLYPRRNCNENAIGKVF